MKRWKPPDAVQLLCSAHNGRPPSRLVCYLFIQVTRYDEVTLAGNEQVELVFIT